MSYFSIKAMFFSRDMQQAHLELVVAGEIMATLKITVF